MLNPKILIYYRKEENLSEEAAAKKIGVKLKTLINWEEGKSPPSFTQLEKMAKAYRVVLGYLTLNSPVILNLPIADFRTPAGSNSKRPSKELLESIYDAKYKQNWIKEIRIDEGVPPVIVLDGLTKSEELIAKKIREDIGISSLQESCKNKDSFLKELINALDERGFLIIKNGVLGFNNRRPLNAREFKGFAIFDEMAPCIFINGKDFTASQIFTIAHELAHLYLKESGVDGNNTFKNIEQKCNRIASNILIPSKRFSFERGKEEQLARQFKVSVFVVLIKAKQLNEIDNNYFKKKWAYFENEVSKVSINKNDKSGGNYYNNIKFKVGGNNFFNTVAKYTLAGKTLYHDAYRLTGLKGSTFNKYCNKQGYTA